MSKKQETTEINWEGMEEALNKVNDIKAKRAKLHEKWSMADIKLVTEQNELLAKVGLYPLKEV